MRRLLLGPLAVGLLAACLMVPQARAADLPYEGTWKVTVLYPVQEVTFWLIKIDKAGKVEIASGFNPNPGDARSPDFGKTKVSEVKAQDKSLRCVLASPAGTFSLAAYPGKGKDKMNGSLRANLNQFLRIRMEKTEDTEVESKKAVKNMAGYADVDAAIKTKDKEDQLKAFQDVLKDHEDKPITYAVSYAVMDQLVKNKAAAEEFKPLAETYLKQAAPYGHEITVGANLAVGEKLLGYDKTQSMALGFIKKASGLLKEDDPKGLQLTVYLAEVRALETNKKADDVKAVIEKLSKTAEATIKTGKDDKGKFDLNQLVASLMFDASNKEVQALGLKYAEGAIKLLKEDDQPARKLNAYQLLREGLRKLDKADEMKKADAKINALESELDKAFEKTSLEDAKGKSILTKYEGRTGKSERVVLVELFTGSECPPCIAADTAFDASLKTYKPKDVVFLQYHLHIPGPDALTNKDTEARGKFYDVDSTPAVFLDGKVIEDMGGFKAHAKARYENLREGIDKNLESAAEGKIKLQVNRKGDRIDLNADVSDLKSAGKTVKLRFALVEETVRYAGRNGQRLHHNVVRALPGGADGIALEEKKGGSHKASVDLAELRKGLDKYLNDAAKDLAKRGQRFSNPSRPMDLKKLKVIAFVQDDDSKKVLQAIQADVPEGAKEDKTDNKEEKDKDDKKEKDKDEKKDDKKDEKKEDKKDKD